MCIYHVSCMLVAAAVTDGYICRWKCPFAQHQRRHDSMIIMSEIHRLDIDVFNKFKSSIEHKTD